MEEEINIRSAEEKAIKEAEFIAASESRKLAQELSLRLKTSETSSKASSRSPSISNLEENNDFTAQNENLQDNINDESENKDEDIIENEDNSEEINQEENIEEEREEIIDENNKSEKSLSQEEVASESSNTQEPIIEVKENEDESQLSKQESKLILNEFRHDSVSFKEEQQENNGHSDDAEITILEESEIQDFENNGHSNDETLLINNQNPLEVHGCGHKLHEISESTKSGISGVFEFQKSIFNSCKNNTNSMNTQLKKSAWNYFDNLHSKLINLAGFHNPDECSICKDFKHQDVPLLN